MKEVAEAYPNLKIIEACENISLLSGEEDDTHHHEGETEEEHAHGDVNAHAWMSVSAYETQVQTIADGLSGADPERSSAYQNGAEAYLEKLDGLKKRQEKLKQEISGQSVILFHEAYAYVAEDYGSIGCAFCCPQGACKIHSCRRTVWKEYGRYDPERVRCKGIISGPAESRNLRKRQLY